MEKVNGNSGNSTGNFMNDQRNGRPYESTWFESNR